MDSSSLVYVQSDQGCHWLFTEVDPAEYTNRKGSEQTAEM